MIWERVRPSLLALLVCACMVALAAPFAEL